MNRVLCAALILAAALSASAADKRTVTWIGGASGSLFAAENWDPALEFPDTDKNWRDWARITNTVTFTENNATFFWRNSRLSISGNSTVTFKSRFWTALAKYLTPDKETFVDIETGSTLAANYMIGGIPTCTFVKTGGGKISGRNIGSNGNLFSRIRILEGTVDLSGDSNNALRAINGIEIGSGARVSLSVANSIDTATTGARALVKVDGILDLNSKAQKVDGLCGSGVITNAYGGLTVQMRAQGQNEFSGKIFGALKVVPLASVPADACLVIAGADSLKYADVSVVPTADNPHPLKFKPGIGVFYVRTAPIGYEALDTEGNPVELRNSARHLYVSCEQADDSGDGLSPQSAYRTIAAALSSPNLAPAPDLNVVHVTKGVYDEGEMGSANDLSRAVVPSNVRLVADDKSEGATVIVGRKSDNPPANCRGCGPGAVRCVKLATGARLEGFTLTGGHTYATASSSGNPGGGVECADYSSYIVDCVISNNVSFRGGGGHKGTYIRTKIFSNFATEVGSGLYEGCYLYNCAVNGNDGVGFYSAGSRSIMVNCLFGPSGTSIRADGHEESSRSDAYNTVFMSPVLTSKNNMDKLKLRMHNCIAMDTVPQDVEIKEDCTVTNGFANAADKLSFLGMDENFRPVKAVPGVLVNGGSNVMYSLPANENPNIDLAGALRISGGAIDLGPYEADFTRTFAMIDDKEGGISVEGIGAGITEVGQGESVTVTIKRTFESDRLCVGFTVNGEFVDFEDYPDGWTVNIEGGDLSNSLVIQTKYVETSALYVDSENGSDSNRGYHIACAKKTLAAAFTPAPAAGTVVYAAPGWYTNETMTVPDSNLGIQHYRVVIPNRVSLVSLEGADRTFIGGESSDQLSDHPRAQGCGEGAVACVKLGSASLLRGFTCFGGRTKIKYKAEGGYIGNSGGGVHGNGIAEDCVFDDCRAYRGGGACYAEAIRRCRFRNCSSVDLGAAINECLNVYNCVFDACTNGSYVASYSKPIVNSVFLPNCGANIAVYYIKDHQTYPYSVSNVMNSAVFCAPFKHPVYTCCAFMQVSDIEGVSLGEGSMIVPASRFTVLDVADMNADGSLREGSTLIDAGSNLLYRAEAGNVDLAKGQRVYNGTIDIGAFEYDWRGEFAKALSPSRRFTVMEAGANVTKDAVGGISLAGGDTVCAEWAWSNGSSRDISFEVSVSGEGVFSYSLCGGDPVAVDCAGGKAEVVLKNVSSPMNLKMEFSGGGTAQVSSFRRSDNGTKLIVR